MISASGRSWSGESRRRCADPSLADVVAVDAAYLRIISLNFALPAVWLSRQPWFELRHLWYVSVCTVALQAAAAWWMLSLEMKDKLRPSPLPEARAAVGA